LKKIYEANRSEAQSALSAACLGHLHDIATDRKLRTTINSQSTLLKASTADLS